MLLKIFLFCIKLFDCVLNKLVLEYNIQNNSYFVRSIIYEKLRNEVTC